MTRPQDNITFMRTSAGVPWQAEPLAPGTRLGPWAIEAAIASGGMGQVYRASRADGAYRQAVAIKLIHDRDPVRVARFEAERQRLAEMDHPGIARIIDGGTHEDGRPWMAMELVDGAPIMPQAAGLAQTEKLRLFHDLCRAVAHAHGRLVLHRDLKSANVLLDEQGAVRLIDFGIATLAEADAEPSTAYTAATAAPEQMRGAAPSVASDIFALGCILHELLTGTVPARDETGGAILDAAAIADRDLVAILRQATAHAPADRYASVDALASDVMAVLTHHPVAARNGGAAYRAGRFLRRAPVASLLAASFVAALVGGTVISLNYARRAEAEAARAQNELARAEYFLARNDTVNHAREAYADALQAMFASDADTERMTRLLLEQWQKAHENRAANPLQAAALSYSIGRHFVYRNDYVTGLKILEPWMAEGYGPPELLALGKTILAFAHQHTGEREKAEALFREQLRFYEASFEANSLDHAAAASDLATLTRDPDDLAAAEALLQQVARKPDHPPDLTSYLWNQTGLMRLWQGNRQGALEAWREAVALIDANPLASPAGRDTRRLNLASAEFHIAQSPEAARSILNKVLGEDWKETGLNREIGRALGLRGEIALSQGRLDEAIADLELGANTIARFAGTLSGDWALVQSALVEALVQAGRVDAARRAQAALDERDEKTGKPYPPAMVSKAMLASATGDRASARALLDAVTADPAKLATSTQLPSRLQRAEAWMAAARDPDAGDSQPAVRP